MMPFSTAKDLGLGNENIIPMFSRWGLRFFSLSTVKGYFLRNGFPILKSEFCKSNKNFFKTLIALMKTLLKYLKELIKLRI